jgi:hypothetical protein
MWHFMPGPAAGCAYRPGHHVGPHVHIGLCIAHHGRLAGGAGRGMNAHHLVLRHGKHGERIIVAQVGLHGERELRKVRQAFKV